MKSEALPDGSRVVYGKATDGLLDLDKQIVDPDWAAKALTDWFAEWGNIRQMHSPLLAPAGKAVGLDLTDDGAWVRSQVVEPTSVRLVDEGVYKAYSIGIINPEVVYDPAAPNGRIVGGVVNEVSLVDYPANTRCKISLAKRAKDGTIETGEHVEVLDSTLPADPDRLLKALLARTAPVTKRDFTAEERRKLAEEGKALPDGSYPVTDTHDLESAAILARSGHGDVAAAKRLIARRAKELGVPNPLDEHERKAEKMADDREEMDDHDLPGGHVKCPVCKGSGKLGENDCFRCDGAGHVPDTDDVTKGILGAAEDSDREDRDEEDRDGHEDGEEGRDGRDPERSGEKIAKSRDESSDEDRHEDGDEGLEGLERDGEGVPAADRKVDDALEGVQGALDDAIDAQDDDDEGWRDRAEKGAPFVWQRAHDLLCPAHDPAATKAFYQVGDVPLTDIISPSMFAEHLAGLASKTGRPDAVTAAAQAYTQSYRVSALRAPVFEDLAAAAHKAFQDAYPDVHVTPGLVDPEQLRRGFLPTATPEVSTTTRVPVPGSHPLTPERFDRGPLTANETRPSLVGGDPATVTAKGRTFYRNADRDAHADAMGQLHDHITALYPDCCPMNRPVGGTGADAAPYTDDVTKGTVDVLGRPAGIINPDPPHVGTGPVDNRADGTLRPVTPGNANKTLGTGVPGTGTVNPDELRSMIAEEASVLVEPYRAKIRTLEKRLKDLEALPDPTRMPIRGGSPLNFAGKAAGAAPADMHEKLTKARALKDSIRDPNTQLAAGNVEKLRSLGLTPEQFAALVTAD